MFVCILSAQTNEFCPPPTAGDDYTATAVDLYFSSARYSQCTTISLVDDFILEGVEMFTVNLNTSDATVLLMPAMATVIITDDDCKW